MRRIEQILKTLREDYPELTVYESLSLATQIQRNEILEAGLVVNRDGPSGLEAIAAMLGVDPNTHQSSILKEISKMNDSLYSIASSVE